MSHARLVDATKAVRIIRSALTTWSKPKSFRGLLPGILKVRLRERRMHPPLTVHLRQVGRPRSSLRHTCFRLRCLWWRISWLFWHSWLCWRRRIGRLLRHSWLWCRWSMGRFFGRRRRNSRLDRHCCRRRKRGFLRGWRRWGRPSSSLLEDPNLSHPLLVAWA